jgi:hypothetical protein
MGLFPRAARLNAALDIARSDMRPHNPRDRILICNRDRRQA